jgi:predicted solute-binding protein
VVKPLRLGVVSYLNAVPTVHGLAEDPAFTLVRDVPSRVAEMLHAGEVDLGLIPSVEYTRGDYAIVPGVALASRGPVRSVNLFHRKPLDQVRRVALDTSSRTSVALLKVLLAEGGVTPEYVVRPPDVLGMLEEADAALVIGDPAFYFRGEVSRLDLGQEWTSRTGLPFVWAFWAGRPGAVSAAQVRRLQDAVAAGLRSVGEIAAAYNGLGRAYPAENEAYLRHHIAFGLAEPELSGLSEFYRRAHAIGLIPRVPELRFHAHS